MKDIRYLSFEISTYCNYASRHPWCPVNRISRPDRRLLLNDALIIDAIKQAYTSLGFRGCVCFHYYNEPTWALPRIYGIITGSVPEARYSLWTNGSNIHTGREEWLDWFDEIYITNYDNRDYVLIGFRGRLVIQRPNPDGRLDLLPCSSDFPCRRLNVEIPIDYYGNMHMCCMDWENRIKIGNLKDADLATLVTKRREIERGINEGGIMRPNAPNICRRCCHRG